jgi:hypothetical protein
MSFSFRPDADDAIPIAKEREGRRIIYLNTIDPDAPNVKMVDSQTKFYECVKCGHRVRTLKSYKHHILTQCPINVLFELESTKEINPLPTLTRQVIYCAGSQNAGKSYRMASYINYWIKMFPDRPVIVISRLTHDETFDLPEFNRLGERIQILNPEADWLTNKFRLEEFRNCLLCFDDIMSSNWVTDPELDFKKQIALNKNIQQYLLDLALDVVQNGRHENIGVFITSHDLYAAHGANGISRVLKDCTDFIIFVRNTSEHHLNYFLKEYVGLTKGVISRVKALNSRWTWIHKDSPRYLMWDHGISRYDLITASPKASVTASEAPLSSLS